jgi:hypothetical protein
MFLIPYKSHFCVLQLEKSSVCSQTWHNSRALQRAIARIFPTNDHFRKTRTRVSSSGWGDSLLKRFMRTTTYVTIQAPTHLGLVYAREQAQGKTTRGVAFRELLAAPRYDLCPRNVQARSLKRPRLGSGRQFHHPMINLQ